MQIGEELPKKFKMLGPVLREEMIFTYNSTCQMYIDNKNSPISMNLSDNLKNLNEEIEIIEEGNLIEYVGKEYDLTNFYNEHKEAALLLIDMSKKKKRNNR